MNKYRIVFLIVCSVVYSWAYAGEKEDQQEIDKITNRLVEAHLTDPVDEAAVGQWVEAMQPDGSFSGIDYVTVFPDYPAGVHLKRLRAMALAYRKPGNEYSGSGKLLNKIQWGFDYWYKMQPDSQNWWYRDIGAPQDYMVALILLKGKINTKKLMHYSSYLQDRTGNQAHRGKNRTWVSDVTIHKGCIEDKLELISIGFESIASTIKIVPRQGDEGIKIDGSFHQHRPQLYSGGYGLSIMTDLAHYILLSNGTMFAPLFTPEKKQILSDVLLNGHRWLGYRGYFDFGSVGRNLTRQNGIANISPVVLDWMKLIDPTHAADYQTWKEHLGGAAYPVPGNKHFWKSDIMTQHGANYYLSAKIISARTLGTEMINNENLKGYNLPMGATNIMISGEEYRNIYPLWDWSKVPGTTAVQHPDSASLTGYLFGKNEFGGGVSNGRNGVMAYEHDYKGVRARKAYFFIDDVLLCLGAGITSNSPEEVVTTVNQCYFSGDMAMEKSNCPSWVHHGKVGYFFPNGGDIVAGHGLQTGSWSDINSLSGDKEEVSGELFHLWVNHGRQAMDKTYAYMVVPDQSLTDFQSFLSGHTYKIVENTAAVQAVQCGKTQSYAVVFYQPGRVVLGNNITLSSDRKAIVYMEKQGDGFRIWASDPLYSQRGVSLMLNGRKMNILFPTGAFTGSAVSTDMVDVGPFDLQCEYLNNPLGLDLIHPRLSWKMETSVVKRGQKQSAYQILVASTQALLDADQGDLWDSGQVSSSESVNVMYGGKTLTAGGKYLWKVRQADELGRWSAWSSSAFWTMGLLPSDWKAQWIGSAEMEVQSVGGKQEDNKMSDPWLRKTFVLSERPEDAMMYVASVGYHELYVNGQKVGDAVLSPSVTDHQSRARYRTYDISGYLKAGDNVIAIWLGVSWSVFPAYQTEDKPAIPLVLAQAEIGLPAAKKLQIVTDATWKVHASPNRLLGYWDAHHFEGEYYDANLEKKGWNQSGFDDSSWAVAKAYRPRLTVSADRTEPNQLMDVIKPLSVEEVKPGVYRVDMGINYAGWFEMSLTGQQGDSITFEFAERNNSASSFGIHSIYKIGPEGKGVFCNRFNYMTGRWVQVSGLRAKPDLDQIRGWMIRPDYHRAGGFECDVPLLNSIYKTTLWTFENLSLGNYVVDCPHRERRGYGGDALATTRMALGNYQLGAFYTKWMEDWRDVQHENGDVPYTAPTYLGGGGPSWSGYCITLPWEMYRQYGDTTILVESFPTIQRWLSFLETQSKANQLVRWGGKWGFLGDWLWPEAWPERSAMEKQGKALGDTRETLFFNNCHWIYSLETAAQIADVLNRTAEARIYRKRAAEVRKAVHATFYCPNDHRYVNGYPAYLAMALQVGLPPISLKEKVWKRLEQEIQIKRKGHFWGGITAGSFLFHTLLDCQRNDLISEMAMKEDFPCWGYMLKQGNGTFFEDWECRGSALHSSYLYIGSWFIESLGGIRQPKAGFKQFVIEPWINPQGPKQVCSHYDSLYGQIVSNWKVEGNKLTMEVMVPPNTNATLKLHHVAPESLEEGGKHWSESADIKLESQNKEGVIVSLASGCYQFSAALVGLFTGKAPL